MINISKPFIIYADCSIIYSGRAESTIGSGLRVIIKKSDNSLLIHNSTKITPLNYLGPKSKIEYENNIITAKTKNESITITINQIINYIELMEWSNDNIKLNKTESQLCDKIINIRHELIPNIVRYERELMTHLGPIDIVFTDADNIRHCLEVKRGKITSSNVYQLYKYMKYLESSFKCIGYLVGPGISDKALNEAKKMGYIYLNVNH